MYLRLKLERRVQEVRAQISTKAMIAMTSEYVRRTSITGVPSEYTWVPPIAGSAASFARGRLAPLMSSVPQVDEAHVRHDPKLEVVSRFRSRGRSYRWRFRPTRYFLNSDAGVRVVRSEGSC